MSLTVEAYDAEERDALERVGYTEHAAFGTKTFDDHWFPSRMTREDQIFRYVDWYNEQDLQRLEPGQFYREASLETNYSMDEVQLLTKLSKATGAITEELCGRRIAANFNHQGTIGLFRVVHAISELSGEHPLSVFEIGPGCGYVGAMIGSTGHHYASYDVTQGYYIWQSRLLENLFGEEFTEFAANPQASFKNPSRLMHLPWWRFMNLYRDCPIKADVIISNANLGEMNTDCMRYVIRIARIMMEKSPIALFIFSSLGLEWGSSIATIDKEFDISGFECVFDKNIYAFCPKGHGTASNIVATLEESIPLYDTTGSGKIVAIRDFINFDSGEFGDEYYFNAFIHDWPDME